MRKPWYDAVIQDVYQVIMTMVTGLNQQVRAQDSGAEPTVTRVVATSLPNSLTRQTNG